MKLKCARAMPFCRSESRAITAPQLLFSRANFNFFLLLFRFKYYSLHDLLGLDVALSHYVNAQHNSTTWLQKEIIFGLSIFAAHNQLYSFRHFTAFSSTLHHKRSISVAHTSFCLIVRGEERKKKKAIESNLRMESKR